MRSTSAGPTPAPLASKPFRFLLAARTMSLFGNTMAPVALAFAVLDLTGSATDLGLVVASRSVTNVALLLFGGVIADRLPRSVVLVGSSAAGAATQAIIAVLVLTEHASITTLALLSVANGAVAAVSFPASAALLPETVPPQALQRANSVLRFGVNSATVLGAGLGGLIVATVGPGWGLAVDAACFAAAGLFFARIRLHPGSPAQRGGASVLADLRDGWREFASRNWLVRVVAQFAVVNAAFVGGITVLAPTLLDQSLGRSTYGFVLAAQTVGYFVAALVAYRVRPQRPLRSGVAVVLLMALPMVALAARSGLVILLLAAFAAGFALEQFAIFWDLSLQQHVPKEALARVYSYDAVGSFLAVPLGEIAVGPVADRIGIEETLLICAAAITMATVIALSGRQVWRLRRTD